MGLQNGGWPKMNLREGPHWLEGSAWLARRLPLHRRSRERVAPSLHRGRIHISDFRAVFGPAITNALRVTQAPFDAEGFLPRREALRVVAACLAVAGAKSLGRKAFR
jgi:hypothetical protein